MPDYLHPGVYIEERPSPQTIEGVSTSTAGFVGATERGPSTGLPRLVTSFAEFNRLYGGYLPEAWGTTRFLAYAVEGFFVNGGQRVYVARVVSAQAKAASLELRNGFVARLSEDPPSTADKRRKVVLTSLRGIGVGSKLTFSETIAGNKLQTALTVTRYDSSKNAVELEASLDLRYTAAGCIVTVGNTPAPEGSGTVVVLSATATSKGDWGDAIEVTALDCNGAVALARAPLVKVTELAARTLIFAPNGPPAGATSIALSSVDELREGDVVEFTNQGTDTEPERRAIASIDSAAKTISWEPGLTVDYSAKGAISLVTALRIGAANHVVVAVADTTGLTPGDLVWLTQGANRQIVRIGEGEGDVNADEKQITLDTSVAPIEATYEAGASLVLATAGRRGTKRLDIGGAARNFYAQAVIEIDDGHQKRYAVVKKIDGQSLVLQDDLDRDVLSDAAVRVVEFSLVVSDGTTRERFDNLAMDPEAPHFVERMVNGRSRLISVAVTQPDQPGLGVPFHLPRSKTGGPAGLTGGDNGDPPTAEDYIGEDLGPGKRTGIRALAEIDNISIIAAPGFCDVGVHNALINQCSELKDRFAVLDPAPVSDVGSGAATDVIVQRNNYDTFYAALYYPWIAVPAAGGKTLFVPPSGHVIGIYARVDTERGVFKAPANEVVRGIAGVEVKLGDREQDVLNPAPTNINVIRDFRDHARGIRVWGARCLTSDNSWKYIPVRRLFIFVEKSLYQGMQWVVFEPNAEPLWAKVRLTVVGFLRRLWLNGALMGASEDEAFFVRCDRSTMTEDDIANGRMIVIVGIAPVRPAEFVIIQVAQKTLEAKE